MHAVLFLESVQVIYTLKDLISLDPSKLLWRDIIFMYFYITCSARILSSKLYLKLYVTSKFLLGVCDVQRENKNNNKKTSLLPKFFPGCPVIKLKQILSAWLLHLVLMDGGERNFGSILQLVWPDQLNKQRGKCVDLLLVYTTTCYCMKSTEWEGSVICNIFIDNLKEGSFIYHTFHTTNAWTQLTDTAQSFTKRKAYHQF